ncbi:LLM class flavin-dependent oxidoreductase [Amycolatopsis jejuensis]|uniref:LLM class flavin-dependent oxidoreductase n=1 Tax=Amycolatopsis jejuensis TaxID=330084 RepID=UPI000525F390|nr:LLM class flavin-dependent oxidoreductase [Amycolatopsis jejuensis]
MKVPTLGLALDLAPPAGETYADRLRALRPLLERAGPLGYDSIWAGESYVYRRGDPMGFHSPNALMALVALAPFTTVARLGTGALLVPAWENHRLAHDVALADQLTDGRLVLGLGLGPRRMWAARSADGRIGAEFERTVENLRSRWTEPLPVQPAGPPVWIGGAIPKAAERAARIGDAYTASTGYELGLIRKQAERYRAAGGTGAVSANRLTVIARSESRAHHLGQSYVDPLLAAYAAAGTWQPGAPRDDLALVGTPETVARAMLRYVEAGVTHLQLRISPRGLPLDAAAETLDLAATEVVPLIQELIDG